MLLIELVDLTEVFSTFPETNYGYWITDKGKFISVSKNRHAARARDLFQPVGEVHMTAQEALDAAEDGGWMRVIFQPNSARKLAAAPTKNSTPQSFKALRMLVKNFGQYVKEIHLHLKGTQHYYRGDNAEEALSWINKLR